MMIRIAAILILLWANPCFGLDVTFKQSSLVKNDTVLLADIASMSEVSPLAKALGSQIVGSAPDAGSAAVLDAREIIHKIEKTQNSSLKSVIWKGAPLVTLTRESVIITSEKIRQIIDDYLKKNRHRLPDAQISFTPDMLPLPFELETGSHSWDVIPSSPNIIGSSRFSIIFKVNGKVRKNFSVTGQTKAITSVVVTTRRLKYGEILTSEMVTVADRDISSLPGYSRAVTEVIGSVLKRNLSEGAPLDPESVELPPVINRGELVKIVVSTGGLQVTATGIARSNGRQDEMIRVQNTNSNKLIYCRVEAPGLVEVQL